MVAIISETVVGERKLESEKNAERDEIASNLEKPSLAYEDDYSPEIVWGNVLVFVLLHAAGIYGLTFINFSMFVFILIAMTIQMFGVTIGAHRLYTHRSFKANAKLRFLLIFLQTVAVENSIYEWVRDHRVHHKYVDTNADPHNSKRGFFFCHMGWLMSKKHPDVRKFGGRIDMSDLEADKMVMFQHKFYKPLVFLLGFILPRWICCYVMGVSIKAAFFVMFVQYLLTLHGVWMINSGAHMWGDKPFDINASSTDSYTIGFIGIGEGWHNYHHCFPWDYKAAELPVYWCNFSLGIIDFFAWIGWATDLKTVSLDVINKRAARTGDGTRKSFGVDSNNNSVLEKDLTDHSNLWGWDDKEMTAEDKKCVKIIHKCYD